MDMPLHVKQLALGFALLIGIVYLGQYAPVDAGKKTCATIQSGSIVDSFGNPLSVGQDEFGYNYQAHSFNGTYDSSDRQIDGTYFGSTGDFVDDRLAMKWSDPWLSNLDCNGDNLLDRGLENGVVGGTSKGWLTNHIEGEYIDVNGDSQHYTYMTKIGWTGPGSPLWGEYTVQQEVYNDPAGGITGLAQKGTPGLGQNDQWTDM